MIPEKIPSRITACLKSSPSQQAPKYHTPNSRPSLTMPPPTIPPFLLPRGLPIPSTLQTLTTTTRRTFTATSVAAAKAKPTPDKSRTLSQPDKFRPPSHPARLVNPARTGPSGQPVNYGPRLTAAEREAQRKKQYPNMFPPEGTVMHRFLTNRWIHIWIAMVCNLPPITPLVIDIVTSRAFLNVEFST